MTQLSRLEHAGLINAFSEIGDQIDVLIVDTAAGISESVVSFLRASQELLLVVCDEPTSITDAYALIKLMNRDYGTDRFRILANQVRNEQEGRHLFEKLTRVTERFLDVALQYVGIVPYDEAVRKQSRDRKRSWMPTPGPRRHWLSRRLLKKSTAGRCRLPPGATWNSLWSGSSKSDSDPVTE
jgi:flagellar biosynthesis protein FlhG